MPCCSEAGCSRSKPVKIVQGENTGRWFLVTDYAPAGNGFKMKRRHEVSQVVQEGIVAPVIGDFIDAGVDAKLIDEIAAKYGLERA